MEEIVQGAKREFSIALTITELLTDGRILTKPFDLTGNIEIEVCFVVDQKVISKKKTVSSGVIIIGAETNGQIESTLTPTDSDSFADGEGDIEIVVTKPADDIEKFQIEKAFQIKLKKCP